MSDEAVVERNGVPAADPDHGVRIEVAPFGPWETNAYLVWDGRSPDALVVDPGMGAAAPLMERVAANGLTSHRHRQLARAHRPHLRQRSARPGHRGARSPSIRTTRTGSTAATSTASRWSRATASRELREGEQLRIGDLVLDVLHLPGHTEGSVCLYEERLGLAAVGRRALRRLVWPDRPARRQRRGDGDVASAA